MEHHDFTSKFINSELPTTLELATLLYTAPLVRFLSEEARQPRFGGRPNRFP